MMKKSISLLVLVLIALSMSAQSDFDIAQSFMSKKGVKLVNNERFLTRGVDSPYSIYNGEDNKGFAIVVNGSVVGYDTDNVASEDEMPCCLKELILSSYTKKAKTRGDDYVPDWWTPRNVMPINPLMTTKWSQNSPYNDIERRGGICAGIAYAQILHYFRIPQTFEDRTTSDGEYFPITTFNHDLMLDEYVKGKYTEEQAYEVAKFIHYYCHIDCYGLEDVFGMEKHWVESDSTNHYKKIDEFLEQGIPLWVGGNGIREGSGHAFVLDGRDSEGRYHANLGFGGNWDGYYVLPDCNEHFNKYDGDFYVHKYMSTCSYGFYYIIPRLFSWSYTTDVAKPFIYVSSSDDVYNLQGVKVGNSLEGLPKGVYIQNKKKQVVK